MNKKNFFEAFYREENTCFSQGMQKFLVDCMVKKIENIYIEEANIWNYKLFFFLDDNRMINDFKEPIARSLIERGWFVEFDNNLIFMVCCENPHKSKIKCFLKFLLLKKRFKKMRSKIEILGKDVAIKKILSTRNLKPPRISSLFQKIKFSNILCEASINEYQNKISVLEKERYIESFIFVLECMHSQSMRESGDCECVSSDFIPVKFQEKYIVSNIVKRLKSRGWQVSNYNNSSIHIRKKPEFMTQKDIIPLTMIGFIFLICYSQLFIFNILK